MLAEYPRNTNSMGFASIFYAIARMRSSFSDSVFR